MNRHRTALATIAMMCLFWYANGVSARPTPNGVQQQQEQQAEWRTYWRPVQPAGALPTLQIILCADCSLSQAELSAISQAYALAAYNAGFRLDALATTQVMIVETGTMANGAPYAKGETGDMWFRVGNPPPGESLGAAAGRLAFVILSGAR